MGFTPQSSLSALMAEITDRSVGVTLAEQDEYGCLFSVQVAIYDSVHATWTWNDISAYVRSVEWDRGATDPLTQPPVGTATVIVDNHNGYFSPWNTSIGPFAGGSSSLIIPHTPMRFGVNKWNPLDHSQTEWQPWFSGRIERIEETTPDPTGADAVVTYTIVDVAGSLAAHNVGQFMGGGPGALHAWAFGAPILLPLTITTGTNDTFQCGGLTYTIAGGTYTTLAAVASAVNAALHSGTAFDTVVLASALDLGLLLTVVATGTSTLALAAGATDALASIGFAPASPAFSTYEDAYYGEPGSSMLPNLLTDCGFGFGFIDGVVSVNPTDPFWTVAPLQSPARTTNRLVAAQDIGNACNCMVFASSSGCIIAVRYGPAVTGSPDFGTFSNDPTDGYPIVDAVIYASTDRILNIVTGQRIKPNVTSLELVALSQSIGTTNPSGASGVMTTHATDASSGAAATTVHSAVSGDSTITHVSQHHVHETDTGNAVMTMADAAGWQYISDAGGFEVNVQALLTLLATGANIAITTNSSGDILLAAQSVGSSGHVKIEGESFKPEVGNTDGNVLTRVSGIWQGAGISAGSIALASGDILVGNASNLAAAVALTGDASITNAGVLTVVALRGHTVKNAAPTDAQALLWNNSNSDWEPVSLSGDGTITNAGVLTVTALRGHTVKNAAPTDAQLFLWNNSNSDWEPVSLSGDATVTNAGVLTIGAGVVTGSKIASSVALAGSPTTTTQSAGDNSTKIATTAYADREVAGFTATAWTPTVSQFNGPTVTVNSAKYWKVGDFLEGYATVTLSQAGTLNNAILVSTPTTMAADVTATDVLGSLIWFPAAGGAYKGILLKDTTSAFIIEDAITTTNVFLGGAGSSRTAALAVGDVLSFTFRYRTT